MADETKKLQLVGSIWGALLRLKTGKVGQLIRISAVDESGGIVALEAADDAKELPEVTATDNGKILQVVDGAWKTVALADSSVKTYIDEYINSALEGDY